MGFFWLACTALAECAGYIVRYWVGVWFAPYPLHIYQWFAISHRYPVTATQIGWGFVGLGVLLHLVSLSRQVPREHRERIRMHPRRPSKQEEDMVERAYKAMRHHASINDALPFTHPKRFRVYQGEGHQVRFLGGVLLIDAALLQMKGSPYLSAQLAHVLWYYNSGGLQVHRLLTLFPEAHAAPAGFFGRFLTWLPWQLYQRDQVYKADAYAAKLGQKQALLQTLEELLLPFDEPRQRAFSDNPYIELRIDRLHTYLL